MTLKVTAPSIAGVEETRERIIANSCFFADSALIYPPMVGQPVIVATTGLTQVRLCDFGSLTSVSVGQDVRGTVQYMFRTPLTFAMWEAGELLQPDVTLPLALRS